MYNEDEPTFSWEVEQKEKAEVQGGRAYEDYLAYEKKLKKVREFATFPLKMPEENPCHDIEKGIKLIKGEE